MSTALPEHPCPGCGKPTRWKHCSRGCALRRRWKGRREIIAAEIAAKLAKAFARHGATLGVAAEAAGISRQSLRAWLRDGARDAMVGKETELAAFHHAVLAAQATAAMRKEKPREPNDNFSSKPTLAHPPDWYRTPAEEIAWAKQRRRERDAA